MKLYFICIAAFLSACKNCPEPTPPQLNAVDAIQLSPIEKNIVVEKILVTKSYSFGYVPEGSVLFDYSRCEKGYAIYVMEGEKKLSTTYSNQTSLNRYLDLIKYKMSQKDTIINNK